MGGSVELESSYKNKGFSGDLADVASKDDPLAFIGVAKSAGEGRSYADGVIVDGTAAELIGRTEATGELGAFTEVGAIESQYNNEASTFIEGLNLTPDPTIIDTSAGAGVRGALDGGWGLMTKDGATAAGYFREGEIFADGFAVGDGNTLVEATVTNTGVGEAALVGTTPEADTFGGQTGSIAVLGNIAAGMSGGEEKREGFDIFQNMDGKVPYVGIYGGGKYIYGGFEESGALDYGFTQGRGGALYDGRDGSSDVTLKSTGVGIAAGLATAGEVYGFDVNGASVGGRGFGFGVGDARIEKEPALGLDDELDVVVNSGQRVKAFELGPDTSTYGNVLGDADAKSNTGTFGGGKGIEATSLGYGFGLVDLEAQAGNFGDGVFGRGVGFNEGEGFASPAGDGADFFEFQETETTSLG